MAIHPIDLVTADWVTACQYVALDGLMVEIGIQAPCPHPALACGSGSPLSCRFFIPGEPRNKNAAPKLGRGVGGEGKMVGCTNRIWYKVIKSSNRKALTIQNPS